MKPEKKHDVKKLHKQLEELTAKVELLEKEKAEIFEQLQRVSADYANYQKRAPKQIADSVAYEKKAVVRSLLPSLDNLSHAMANTENIQGDAKTIVDGVKMVFDHMVDALKAHGVELIESAGKEFDPMLHEAVMQRADETKPNGIVLEEFQKGYVMNGQTLRPSKVIVNKLPDQAPAVNSQTDQDLPADSEESEE
ncbi:MAG: nucleotide exchange factor GrpE [Anaerohalosphaera sp.]|nr:nucleotide exchange factor GrpE [Anaerohalosphaera sp.]